jgi:predicted membrane protein
MKKTTVTVNFSSIIWGIVLVAAGAIFALNSLGLTNIDIFFTGWWTLFIIIPCTISLFTDRNNTVGNLTGIAIGVFLLLCARGILQYSMIWKLLLPTIIVIIGLKMLFKGLFGRKNWADEDDCDEDDEDKDIHTANAIFSAHRINYKGKVFHSAELNVIFGGAQLDLRGAIIEGDCKVRANCIFGGITVLVPDNVNVKVKANNIFGGIYNKTADHPGAHTIYVKGDSIFGGISIK